MSSIVVNRTNCCIKRLLLSGNGSQCFPSEIRLELSDAKTLLIENHSDNFQILLAQKQSQKIIRAEMEMMGLPLQCLKDLSSFHFHVPHYFLVQSFLVLPNWQLIYSHLSSQLQHFGSSLDLYYLVFNECLSIDHDFSYQSCVGQLVMYMSCSVSMSGISFA